MEALALKAGANWETARQFNEAAQRFAHAAVAYQIMTGLVLIELHWVVGSGNPQFAGTLRIGDGWEAEVKNSCGRAGDPPTLPAMNTEPEFTATVTTIEALGIEFGLRLRDSKRAHDAGDDAEAAHHLREAKKVADRLNLAIHNFAGIVGKQRAFTLLESRGIDADIVKECLAQIPDSPESN